MSDRSPSKARRWLANLGWVVVGIFFYCVSIDMFGGYPQYHSATFDWIGVVLIVCAGAYVWWRHGRATQEDP